MNAPVTFNTLAFVRKLEASGMETRQAEAVAEAFGDALQELVATKADVMDLGRDLRAELRDMELRLTVRMGAISAAGIALIVTILGALISLQ